jgi:hypothetical protein
MCRCSGPFKTPPKFAFPCFQHTLHGAFNHFAYKRLQRMPDSRHQAVRQVLYWPARTYSAAKMGGQLISRQVCPRPARSYWPDFNSYSYTCALDPMHGCHPFALNRPVDALRSIPLTEPLVQSIHRSLLQLDHCKFTAVICHAHVICTSFRRLQATQ